MVASSQQQHTLRPTKRSHEDGVHPEKFPREHDRTTKVWPKKLLSNGTSHPRADKLSRMKITIEIELELVGG